ncbi:MAG TPA: hypothetical protein VNI84_15510 [Pyrinomonadaceae bacterium]|nr:hypothetical protein [Pyrinomonadaceae bacterium]
MLRVVGFAHVNSTVTPLRSDVCGYDARAPAALECGIVNIILKVSPTLDSHKLF